VTERQPFFAGKYRLDGHPEPRRRRGTPQLPE
jgi:hypothetical protein